MPIHHMTKRPVAMALSSTELSLLTAEKPRPACAQKMVWLRLSTADWWYRGQNNEAFHGYTRLHSTDLLVSDGAIFGTVGKSAWFNCCLKMSISLLALPSGECWGCQITCKIARECWGRYAKKENSLSTGAMITNKFTKKRGDYVIEHSD